RLEDQLAAYVGCQHCVTVANGTEALLIALMAIGVKPGDEVITSPFSFVANAETIAFLGAKPIFVDIDPQTYLLDPTTLEAAITPKTKAIIAVNLYGQCADFDVINQIARQYYLPVIEDAAQSFGAGYKDRRSGALSTIGCTSFFPSKPLGAYGDGGACFTDDDQLAEMMRHLRIHGQSERYQHNILGLNSRLDTLQASLLLAKLPIFDQEIEKRNQIGQHYTQLLRDKVQTPVIAAHNTSVYAQYTIEVDNRDNVSTQLHQRGIPTAVHYPLPVHLQPALAHLRYEAGQFPVAERAAQRVLNLPLYPYMHLEAVEQVAEELVKVLPS
ncbi:MAG: DegT/DnrJ/EryC1/StrS family aminotransferase, partial [Pseudomonadota bacterium]|nr:DegT/DnrJ/EryC1/StrS family aminotransferase [Pseudomonadota bacterium]